MTKLKTLRRYRSDDGRSWTLTDEHLEKDRAYLISQARVRSALYRNYEKLYDAEIRRDVVTFKAGRRMPSSALDLIR